MASPLTVEWEPALFKPNPPGEYEREAKQRTGEVPPPLSYLTGVPWLARYFVDEHSTSPQSINGELLPLMALVVSQDNSCRHCYGAFRSMLLVLGYTAAQVDQMEADINSQNLKDPQRLALQFVQQLSRSNPRPVALFTQLKAAGFSTTAIAELVTWGGVHIFGNRVATLLAMPPSDGFERFAKSRWLRFLHPFLARKMRKTQRRAVATPLADAENQGPFSTLLRAVKTSPLARPMRQAADGAFASPLLPKRIKVLMFAVVGRALECSVCEVGARELALSCDVPLPLWDEAVATLASTELKPEEELLLKFARSTVRYRPAEAQRLTRALLASYSPAQVVEAVGIAALANMFSRMTTVLDLD